MEFTAAAHTRQQRRKSNNSSHSPVPTSRAGVKKRDSCGGPSAFVNQTRRASHRGSVGGRVIDPNTVQQQQQHSGMGSIGSDAYANTGKARRASIGGYVVNDEGTSSRRKPLDHSSEPVSVFDEEKATFYLSYGDVNAKEIADFLDLPKYEIAKVDHTASIPGRAYSHGYVQHRVEVRKPAMEMINLSFEKFHYRKSYWTIVPKIPFGTRVIIFCDDQRRSLRKDTSEGDYASTTSSEADLERQGEKGTKFYVERANGSVVFARSSDDPNFIDFCDQFDITDLPLPLGYDVLINPFFFAGDDHLNGEVARDITNIVASRDDKFVYASTLNPATGQHFLFLFGMAWQDLIYRVTENCKAGLEEMEWPRFLDEIKSNFGPAPDYYDIPRGYYTYAAGLLLGMYKNVGVRELWAAGGLIGMYSFARRVPSIDSKRDVAVILAMLREATFGCRSRKLGVRLLHLLPAKYHQDYVALCTLPWSKAERITQEKEWTVRRDAPMLKKDDGEEQQWTMMRNEQGGFDRVTVATDDKKSKTSGLESRTSIRESLSKRRSYMKTNIVSSMGKFSKQIYLPIGDGIFAEGNRVQRTASRYVLTIDNPKSRAMMNFMGSVGYEMLNIPYPTMISGTINVISESFLDPNDAKQELRFFADREKLLPGAVLRTANFTETTGGVLNVIQEGVNTTNGHIEWIRKYSFVDAIATLVMLGISSYLGWVLNTGVFHFLMALTVLTRISEEVAIIGTYYVLVKGRKYGYKMYEDSLAQFLVPAALGSVEAAYGLIRGTAHDPKEITPQKITLIFAGLFAFGIVFLTMVARLKFKDNKGKTYEEVLERDGSIECLLTGENETGLRSIDHPNGPGVGPLQAQLFSLCESNGGDVASSTAAAPYHVSGQWMIAGTLQRNHEVDFGTSGALGSILQCDDSIDEIEVELPHSMSDAFNSSGLISALGDESDFQRPPLPII